jgi:hypothetical protein
MEIITLAKTKELLGVGDTSLDTQITAKIPYIDSIVKQITNNRFNYAVYGSLTTGSATVYISSIVTYGGNRYYYDKHTTRYFCAGINNYICIDDIGEYLEIGQQLSGTGIPAETYIDEVYYNGSDDPLTTNSIPYITMSEVATDDTDTGKIYLGMNISYQHIVAKGIQYLITGTSQTLPTNSLASRSLGPSAKSFSKSAQDKEGKNGMPAWFNSAFPVYMSGH